MWTELKADNLIGLKSYADIVKGFFASDEYYEEASELYLARQLTNKGSNLKYFLYDDGKKQMAYGLKYSDAYLNPYTKEKGMWKVADLSYWGDWGVTDIKGVSQEAVKFGCDAIRKKLDELGITQGYIILNMDTERVDELAPELVPQAEVFLNFLNEVQDEIWEMTEKIPFEDGTHYVIHFNRKK